MKKNLLLLPVICFLFSCNEDTTPSWLEITSIDLITNEVVEGIDSQGITDAWVYMDGVPMGAFELPCRIPILDEGEHAFLIYAGIKENGINGTRTRYPFYNRVETTLTLVKGQTITIAPTVTYKTNLVFALKEDFENVGISFVPEIESDTQIVFVNEISSPEIVKYGNSCGAVFLTLADSLFKASTQSFFDLPQGEDVWMEIDYMSSNSMVMGVIAQNSSDIVEHTPYVLLNPGTITTMVWKKMYINLTDDVSFDQYATSHEVYLLAVLDAINTAGGVIYLDNIKIVHYQ